ncbi:MAG: acyltransferase, partial [Deltaproteobacteria bacterium]|nr:acyltransferase [Deltaproteobacteria bacterium]
MTSTPSRRRYELDWLRILAILVVFVYHSSRFFNLGDWHVKNINTFVWVEIWNVFATRWMMPLFFIISGASLFYALAKSGRWSGFYVDKFMRLMIPVLVAAVTHSALQVYLERLTHGQFSGSFFLFLPVYFNGVYFGIGMPGNFAFHGMHLWYLLFIFLYSLICYRLFVWLKGRGQGILNRIMSWFTVPGLMYVGFSIPLVVMKALIPPAVLQVGNGGWGFVHYIWFLIAGFMVVSSDRLQQHIKNQRWISLLLGVVLMTVYLYQLFSPSRLAFTAEITGWMYALLNYFSTWCWLLAILGFGMRYLAVDRPVLRPANEAVLPFFILHQTVLLFVGYFVMTWQIQDTLKWAIVFISSFIIIILLYGLLVRKFELLRFLFGMKTTHSFFDIFRKKGVLILLHLLYVALIVLAASGASRSRSPMPLTYEPQQDILLNADFITDKSSTGVEVVNDEKASIGKAIEFTSGASQRAES